MELLRKEGALISYHDPYIPHIEAHGGSTVRLDSIELTDEALRGADCILIATDHTVIDYDRVAAQSQLIVDTRNATRNVRDHREKIVKI